MEKVSNDKKLTLKDKRSQLDELQTQLRTVRKEEESSKELAKIRLKEMKEHKKRMKELEKVEEEREEGI